MNSFLKRVRLESGAAMWSLVAPGTAALGLQQLSFGRTGPFSLPAAYSSLNRPDSESDSALEVAKGWVCQGSRPRVPARPRLAGTSARLGGGEG